MNVTPRKLLVAGVLAGSFAALWPAAAFAQAAPAADSASEDSETVVLSPFRVTTSQDKGYRATNSISGSRLDTAIKDIPMPIEVITEQFLRDTGSKDLRQSLRYSAGILLQSQNDYGTPGGAYQGPGGVNNAEGATANKSQSSVKIRGFVTEAVLRDGYLRQNATDSINIGRIEVVRGPAALLYGVGNFGGIVNYLPKLPGDRQASEVGLTVGTYGLKRVTLDTTGPVTAKWGLNYRLTGAWEDAEDYTDFRKHKHHFLSPVITFKPTETTDVLIDFETGTSADEGIGFQRVRSSVGPGPNNDQNEHAAFYTLPGTNPRTYRWSGPDTYLDSDSQNLRVQLTQKITEDLHLMVGYNNSKVTFDKRDVIGNLQGWTDQFANADSAFGMVPFIPAGPNGTSNTGLGTVGGLTRATLAYRWIGEDAEFKKEQVRAELVYRFKLFEKSTNKWLRMDNMFMLGRTELRSDNEQTTFQSAWDQANNFSWVTNYYNPSNIAPLRFGQKQANGTAELPFLKNSGALSTSWNQANYAVFQGKLLNDRVTVVSGARRDRNETSTYNITYLGNGTPSRARSATQVQTTYQHGLSVEIIPELSVYALRSEGLQPNFSGNRDTDGKPLPATMAKSREIGLKVDFFEGKVTGTISAFEIKRTNSPIFYWWAPTSNYGSRFNANKDIVYQINEFQPSSLGGPTWTNGAGQAALAQWNAAVAAGAIYQIGSNWYANASKTTGAAFLDRIFEFTKANGYSWPGWLYNTDANTNHSWDMRASGPDGNEYVLGADTSKGWDTQIMIQPNENVQFVLGYAHVARTVASAGKFSKAPFADRDRWAVWFFPNTDWGLTRVDTAKAYGNPADTSTWNGVNWGQGLPMDDTPEHQFTAWANYAFTKGSLKGLSVGLGGYHESPRLYLSGLTHGGGQQITDKDGNPVMLRTKSRTNIDLMVRYAFKLSDHDASVQLNVNNVLNDRDLYGFIYSAPTTARLEFLYKF